MLVFAFLSSKAISPGKRKNCTVLVRAKVVSVDSYLAPRGRIGGRIEVFCPTFAYEWNGWTRTIQPNAYASMMNYEVGDEVDIYINPDNPAEYIIK